MGCKFTELQCKEVICLSNGQRLGFVSDVLVELPEGKISALVVPGPSKLMGLMGCKDDFIIPWSAIQRIGPDIVLVDTQPDSCRVQRPRPLRGKS